MGKTDDLLGRHAVLKYDPRTHKFLGKICQHLPLQKGQVEEGQPNTNSKRAAGLVSEGSST